jgi:hypothetical protein
MPRAWLGSPLRSVKWMTAQKLSLATWMGPGFRHEVGTGLWRSRAAGR